MSTLNARRTTGRRYHGAMSTNNIDRRCSDTMRIDSGQQWRSTLRSFGGTTDSATHERGAVFGGEPTGMLRAVTVSVDAVLLVGLKVGQVAVSVSNLLAWRPSLLTRSFRPVLREMQCAACIGHVFPGETAYWNGFSGPLCHRCAPRVPNWLDVAKRVSARLRRIRRGS